MITSACFGEAERQFRELEAGLDHNLRRPIDVAQQSVIARIRQALPGGSVLDQNELEARAADGRSAISPRHWTAIMRELNETTRRTVGWDEALAALLSDPDGVIPSE